MSDTKIIRGVLTTRDQAVLGNMGLVRMVAQKYKRKAKKAGLDFEDLESIGAIGLMKAFDGFDDSKGFQFSSYAIPKIRGAINQAILYSADSAVRYPKNVKECARMISESGLENEPIERIATKLETSTNQVKLALDYLHNSDLRLDDAAVNTRKYEEGSSYHELIGFSQDFSSIFVNDFLDTLKAKEREIAELALAGYGTTEIGKRLGFSKSYVRTYMPRIKNKLEKYMAGEKLRRKRVRTVNQEKKSSASLSSSVPKELTEEIYNELRQKGLSNKQIAEKLGIKLYQIYKHKKQWSGNPKPTSPKKEGESTTKPVDDLIYKPTHYHQGGIDVIAYMEMKFPKEQLIGFHRGNVLKYLIRYRDKGGIEDLKKARFYLDKLIEVESLE